MESLLELTDPVVSMTKTSGGRRDSVLLSHFVVVVVIVVVVVGVVVDSKQHLNVNFNFLLCRDNCVL